MVTNDNQYLEFAQNVLDEKNIPDFRLSESKDLIAIASDNSCLALSPKKLFSAFLTCLEQCGDNESNRKLSKRFKIFLDFWTYPECKSVQAQILTSLYYILSETSTVEALKDLDKAQKLLVKSAKEHLKDFIMKSNIVFKPKDFKALCIIDPKLARLKLENLNSSKNYANVLPHLDLTTTDGFEIACFLISNFYIKDHDEIAKILPKIVETGQNESQCKQSADAALKFGVAHLVDIIIKEDIAITTDYYLTKILPLIEEHTNFNIEVAIAIYNNAYIIDGEDQRFSKILLAQIANALKSVQSPQYALSVAKRIEYSYGPQTDDEIYNIYNSVLNQAFTNNRDIINAVETAGSNYMVNINAKHRSKLLALIYVLFKEYGDTYEFTNIKTKINFRKEELQNEELLTAEVIAFWSDSKNSLLWEDAIINLTNMVNTDDNCNTNIKQAIKIICSNHLEDDLPFLCVDMLSKIKAINKAV